MKQKYLIVLFITLLAILYIPIQVFAEGIVLDGNFDDWTDKPYLQDPSGDEADHYNDIIMAKWYPDTHDGNLYLYCERLDQNDNKNGNKSVVWHFNAYLSGDLGMRTLQIDYQPYGNRGEVNLKLFDQNRNVLWEVDNADWGASKLDGGTKLEFCIPLKFIASSRTSGYQIGLYYLSGTDRAPDNGTITISTVSTFPKITAVILILFVAAGFLFFKLRRR